MSDNNITQDYGKEKTIINKPLDWANTLFLSQQAKSLRFARDKDGNLMAIAAVLFDPTNIGSNILAMGKVSIADPNVPNSNARVFASPHQAVLSTSFTGILAQAAQWVYNPVSLSLEVVRMIEGVNAITTAAAGDTTLLSNAGMATKKYRILRVICILSKEAASAGAFTAIISDGAAAAKPIARIDYSAAALVAIGNVVSIVFEFGPNGYIQAAVNTPMYINLSGALTAGTFTANIQYTKDG